MVNRVASTIHSLLEPVSVESLPIGEFIPIGVAPLNLYHVLYLAKEPLGPEAVVVHEHPIVHGPYCTQYIVQNSGGSFLGYLFAVKYKLLKVEPFKMVVGESKGKSAFASVPSNSVDSDVLMYLEPDGCLLAIPGTLESRHIVKDG